MIGGTFLRPLLQICPAVEEMYLFHNENLKKKNQFGAMIILFSLTLGFQWHMQGHRFVCADCKIHEKAMQLGMTANEHQVHILSVVVSDCTKQ